MEEIWKDVKEFENNYQISNYGRLRSKSRKINSSIQKHGYRFSKEKIKVQQDNGNGYKQYYVQIKNKRYIQYAHRLVAKYFINNIDNKPEVNHIDGDKKNNHVSNLEWVYRIENINHAIKNGLHKVGEKCSSSKLTEKDVIYIRNLIKQNPKFNKSELARNFNIADSTIHKIVNVERWKHLK